MTERLIRKKPCRHCLFTKNHVGSSEDIEHVRGVINSNTGVFMCHEHSAAVVCCSYASKHGIKGRKVAENGDLKPKYSNMSRKELDSCTIQPKEEVRV
jgi:hypothetical protein